MDDVVGAIVEARHALRQALGLDRMLMDMDRSASHRIDQFDYRLRIDTVLGHEMDRIRQRALDSINEILADANLPQLKRIGE